MLPRIDLKILNHTSPTGYPGEPEQLNNLPGIIINKVS